MRRTSGERKLEALRVATKDQARGDRPAAPPILPPLHPELRFHNYSSFLRRRLGGPVARISVDGGFTCPNRDGSIGVGGCSYCNNDAFTPGIRFSGLPVAEQVRLSIEMPGRHRAFRRFLVYFQKFSNSYAAPDDLRRRYSAAFSHPDVAGIVVGTRPDCLGEPVLSVLSEIARERYVCVEVGLQSMSDGVLRRIHRGHSVDTFADAVSALRRCGIDVGVHMIYGLPGDSRARFLSAAPFLSRLDVQGVKLHHFHVVAGSALEDPWRRGRVEVPRYDEYLSSCVDFLERLSPEIAVMRLMGEAPPHLLLAPCWPKGPREMASDIAAEFSRRGTFQGACRGRGSRGRKQHAGR